MFFHILYADTVVEFWFVIDLKLFIHAMYLVLKLFIYAMYLVLKLLVDLIYILSSPLTFKVAL